MLALVLISPTTMKSMLVVTISTGHLQKNLVTKYMVPGSIPVSGCLVSLVVRWHCLLVTVILVSNFYMKIQSIFKY